MGDQEPQPHSELASFGEELRREREIRGISLKEISDSTKISQRFLGAIERNDHKTLPAPVFTRGFVRAYAIYLGLSAEDMVSRYNYAAAGDDRIEQSAHLDRLVQPQPILPLPPPRKKGIPPAYARVDRNVYVTFLIIVLLAAVGWWALKYKRQRAAEALEIASHPVAATAEVVPKATAAPPPAPPAATQTNPDVLRLTLDVNDDSWVTLEVDGKTVISDELRQGEHRTFEAKDRFRFKTVGNAGGVAVTINDVHLPSLGRDRQVVHDRVFDRQWLQQQAADARSRT
jgi:cytoskeleton protein RodZ